MDLDEAVSGRRCLFKSRLWGAQIRSSGCCFVFVDKPAEEIATARAYRQCRLRNRCRAVGRHKPEGAVRAMLVVMPDIDTQHALEIAAANEQDPVEAIGSDRS